MAGQTPSPVQTETKLGPSPAPPTERSAMGNWNWPVFITPLVGCQTAKSSTISPEVCFRAARKRTRPDRQGVVTIATKAFRKPES